VLPILWNLAFYRQPKRVVFDSFAGGVRHPQFKRFCKNKGDFSLMFNPTLPRLRTYQRAASVRMGLWLAALREGFTFLLPLSILGVCVTILGQLPQWGAMDYLPPSFQDGLMYFVTKLSGATAGVMGLALAMTVGNRLYVLSEANNDRHVSTIFISLQCLVNFFACISPLAGRSSMSQMLGYQALFSGIAVGIVTVESLRLVNHWLPSGNSRYNLDFNPMFQQAMGLVLPWVLSTTMVFGVLFVLNDLGTSLSSWLVHTLNGAPTWFWQTEVIAPLLVFVQQCLWILGIHGPNLVEGQLGWLIADPNVVYHPILASPSLTNAFANLGGSGATAGLIVVLIFFCKDLQLKRVGYISILPAVVNVNELILFGIPIILNPTMLLPFLLAPLVSLGMGLVAYHVGWMPLTGSATSWNTPLFLSGYLLSGGWSGVLVQACGLAASVLLYLPFVRKLEVQRMESQSAALKFAILAFSNPEITTSSLLKRTGRLGDFARALHNNFERDLGTDRVYQVYQPKHDRTGKVCGVEALIRWNHAVHGHINPAALINIAEESDLINRIGGWTLDAACASLNRWKALGYHLKISVNLSPVQLEDPDCVRIVRRCLKTHGVSVQELELEITEGRSISTTQQSKINLNELSALGVSMSMDDFGMGFTSLYYMQRFAVSAIKIDGSLTREVLTNQVNADVIRTIAILGGKQGAQVVAEFVDNPAQQAMLSELGCNEFQGYLYSKPLREAEFIAYLATNETTRCSGAEPEVVAAPTASPPAQSDVPK
jgi:lactose/cellobiose-specific phosphotransferase system IIC component